MANIIIPRCPTDVLKGIESTGKHRITTGTYIDNLAACGKGVWLCPRCVGKFNKAAYDYIESPGLPKVRGVCDGCRANGTHAMLVPRKHKDGWNGEL